MKLMKTEMVYIRNGLIAALLITLISSTIYYLPTIHYEWRKYNDPNRANHYAWDTSSGLGLSSNVADRHENLLKIGFTKLQILDIVDDKGMISTYTPITSAETGNQYISGLRAYHDTSRNAADGDWLVNYEELEHVNPDGSMRSTQYTELLSTDTTSNFSDALSYDISSIENFSRIQGIDTNDEFNEIFDEKFEDFLKVGMTYYRIDHIYDKGNAMFIEAYLDEQQSKSLVIATFWPYFEYNVTINSTEDYRIDRSFYRDELQFYYGWSDTLMPNYYDTVISFLDSRMV